MGVVPNKPLGDIGFCDEVVVGQTTFSEQNEHEMVNQEAIVSNFPKEYF